MINLLYSNGIVTWNNIEYVRGEMDKIDSMLVHVMLNENYHAFLGNETTINGVLALTSDAIISALT
jgi:hypothetical protein